MAGSCTNGVEALKLVGELKPAVVHRVLRQVRLDDPMKSKQMRKALEDMAEEGVTQVFRRTIGGQFVVGVVGQLQLDVLATRIDSEYNVKVAFETAPFDTARWVSGDPVKLKAFMEGNRGGMAEDRDGAPVFLARNAWELGHVKQKYPDISFAETRERN